MAGSALHRKAFTLLFIVLSASVWGADWQVGPAAASDLPSDAADRPFVAVDGDRDLNAYLTGDEGWLWLKTELSVPGESATVLIRSRGLGLTAWWNGFEVASMGSGPPNWAPSSPLPVAVSLPSSSGQSGTLMMKLYVRPGYGSIPSLFVGQKSEVQSAFVRSVVTDLAVPVLAVLIGLLILVGGIFSSTSRQRSWVGSLALFGTFAALASLEPVLASVPGLTLPVDWTIFAGLTAVAAPFTVSFWRRSISNAGGRDPGVIIVLDTVLVLGVAALGLLPILGSLRVPPPLIVVDHIDLLSLYTLVSLLLGFGLWCYHTGERHPGRWGSLLIILAGMAGPAAGRLLGGFSLGTETALPIAALVMMSRRRDSPAPSRSISEEPHADVDSMPDTGDDEWDDIEELEEVDDLPDHGGALRTAEPETRVARPHSDGLIRGLRSQLFPEAIPWDIRWDLGSARQGSSHPATGFHDVYGERNEIHGFAFMDTGSDSLESTVFAHSVRSELSRSFDENRTLPSIARRVHRKAAGLAGVADTTMIGVIGRFNGESLELLPLSVPSLLVKKARSGRILSLQASSGRIGNPPLGSRGFGSRPLKVLKFLPTGGDVVLAYTPSILDVRGNADAPWGLSGLASALKKSDDAKADRLIADLIEAVKDYSGRDVLDTPIQILAIRRR